MTEDEIKALKAKLAMPHRVASTRVLHDACRKALLYIEQLEAKPKRGRPPKVADDAVID